MVHISRRDFQQNDTRQSDTQQNDTQQSNAQQNDTQQSNAQQNNTQQSDAQQNDTHQRNTKMMPSRMTLMWWSAEWFQQEMPDRMSLSRKYKSAIQQNDT